MGFLVAVGERLIKREVGQRKTTERRLMIVSSVDADSAVKNIMP